jgi:hypothetical protein
MTEKPDLQGCESCGKEYPIESMQMMEDNWFCERCYVAWKQEFDACDHRWKPHTSSMSEPGRLCEKCSGFVADADAASIGL